MLLQRSPASMLSSSMAMGGTRTLRGMSGRQGSHCAARRGPATVAAAMAGFLGARRVVGQEAASIGTQDNSTGRLLALSPASRYGYWMEHFSLEARQRLYTPSFGMTVVGSNPKGYLLRFWPEVIQRNG
jgi:hypothetical protein